MDQAAEDLMQVLVNSDHHIVGGEDLTARVQGVVEGRLERFDGRITRVEVHLNDLNGSKLGERDKRCMMEARVGGLKPIAVSHEAPTLTEAIHMAADKLERALDHALGRLANTMGRTPPEDQVASVQALQELERAEAHAGEHGK
jgi:ribosome-associated translation inhibitor RaiA